MNPIQTLRSMRPTLLLMSGRTIGFAAAFAIPMVLARALDPEEFGTYRFLFLVYGSLLALAQMGMAESLYYFVPQRPAVAGRWVGNAVVTLAAIGAGAAAIVWLSAPLVARHFEYPGLADELPKLGLFLGLMLAPLALEIVMVCRHRYGQAATLYALSDLARAALLTIPVLVAHTLDALMNGALVFAGLRALTAAGYLRGTFRGELAVDRGLWRQQLGYALPFAAAVLVELVQINFHQYAVALWFDAATFAIYSIGCLQIPIVDLLANSAANVMMVAMSDEVAKGQPPLGLWHETIERLAFLLFPLVVVLVLTAHDLIVFLFTAAYAASVPIFVVSTASIALAAFPVDAVLRVYAETRTLLVLNVVRLVVIASGIGWCIRAFGLPGAVLVTVVAAGFAKALGIARVAHLVGGGWAAALPWGSLASIATAAAVAAGPAWLVRAHLTGPPIVAILVTGAVYGVSYLAVASAGVLLRGAMRPAVDATRAA